MVDDILLKLYVASVAAYDEVKCQYPQWGYDNLEWYISTGRASTEFLKACNELSKRRMITLIRKASVSCTEDGVQNAKKYLGI
jgi:hypothetical protein